MRILTALAVLLVCASCIGGGGGLNSSPVQVVSPFTGAGAASAPTPTSTSGQAPNEVQVAYSSDTRKEEEDKLNKIAGAGEKKVADGDVRRELAQTHPSGTEIDDSGKEALNASQSENNRRKITTSDDIDDGGTRTEEAQFKTATMMIEGYTKTQVDVRSSLDTTTSISPATYQKRNEFAFRNQIAAMEETPPDHKEVACGFE